MEMCNFLNSFSLRNVTAPLPKVYSSKLLSAAETPPTAKDSASRSNAMVPDAHTRFVGF